MSRFGLFWIVAVFAATALRGGQPTPFDDARFEQRIGASLPLSTEVIEADGSHHHVRDYFHRRPVVLYFGYASCPQLCSIVSDGTVAALRQIRASVGRDFDVVAVSIDPNETAPAAQARLADSIHRYGDSRSADGWHYLRGSEQSIRSIADAAGFHFVHDPVTRQYAHASGFVVITPAGVVSRYFLGVDFEAADVARAITRAARGDVGEPVFDLVLRCFRGDGVTGRYNAIIWTALAFGTSLTVLGLAGWITWTLRRERRQLDGAATP